VEAWWIHCANELVDRLYLKKESTERKDISNTWLEEALKGAQVPEFIIGFERPMDAKLSLVMEKYYASRVRHSTVVRRFTKLWTALSKMEESAIGAQGWWKQDLAMLSQAYEDFSQRENWLPGNMTSRKRAWYKRMVERFASLFIGTGFVSRRMMVLFDKDNLTATQTHQARVLRSFTALDLMQAVRCTNHTGASATAVLTAFIARPEENRAVVEDRTQVVLGMGTPELLAMLMTWAMFSPYIHSLTWAGQFGSSGTLELGLLWLPHRS